MKIFISWSGSTSHKVAIILRDWLPSVIQSVVPYVSSEDIDKGTRWATDIAGELDQSAFGILCVTKHNVNAPWLNFEAGALGKSVDKSKVCPVLFQIKRSEIQGPILQFQSTIFEKDDVFKLLKSINDSCEEHAIPQARLEKAFEVWWPSLTSELDAIPIEDATGDEVKKEKHASTISHVDKILEEVLELSRVNLKILRNPEELLPPPYFEHILKRSISQSQDEAMECYVAVEDLMIRHMKLQELFAEYRSTQILDEKLENIQQAILRLSRPIEFLHERLKIKGSNKTAARELIKSRNRVEAVHIKHLEDFRKMPE